MYPYPATFLENAGTPQPQNAYDIPPHPLPKFQNTGYGGGWTISPNDLHGGEPCAPDAAWPEGSDAASEAPIYLPSVPASESDYTPWNPDARAESVPPPAPDAP